MEVYFSGSEFDVVVPFIDPTGVEVSAVSASYIITDENEATVVPQTALTLEPGDGAAVIHLGSAITTLPAEVTSRWLRVTATYIDSNGRTNSNSVDLIIEQKDSLRILKNSFQSYGTAALATRELFEIPAFLNATEAERKSALINAFYQLNTLTFYVGGKKRRNLQLMDEAEFLSLPLAFVRALQLAQVVEANELLAGWTMHRKRQAGLLSESIGESTMFWRPEKVLLIPVTRRSLDLLRGYVTWELEIGRG
jgi:hypothetical protein